MAGVVSSTTTPVTRRPRGRRVTARRRRPHAAAAGFLAPFAALFLATYLAPAAYALYKSFFVVRREGAFGAPEEVFGGLDNYSRALGDGEFVESVGRMVLFGAVQYPVMIGLALALALALDAQLPRFKRFFRLAYFAPYAVPTVVAAVMWGFLYSPDLSPVTDWLASVGIGVDFLGSGTVLWSIANVVTWTFCGFNMLILFTALKSIDHQIYEAARADGASAWQIVWRIKLPLIKPALVLCTVFSIIGILQLFTEPQVLSSLTGSITSRYTPSLAAYTEASANNYNYAAAISVLLAAAIAVLSLAFMWSTRRSR